MPYTLYMPVTTMHVGRSQPFLCYFGGPPRPTQQLKVHPGLLRHLLHPCGRPLSHDFGLGFLMAGFFCFFMAGFPFAGARHAHSRATLWQHVYHDLRMWRL